MSSLARASSLTMATARVQRSGKSQSPDSADHLIQVAAKKLQERGNSAAPRVSVTTLFNPETAKAVSRLELLLQPKKAAVTFSPNDNTPASSKVNKAIRLSGSWEDVQEAVMQAPALNATNAAFALSRLGRLNTLASPGRKKDLESSGLVQMCCNIALARVREMDAGTLVLFIDGCARLKHLPNKPQLHVMASCVAKTAKDMNALQLPLVLWGFNMLKFRPREDILSLLEKYVFRMALEITPQSMSLVLSSFQAAEFVPSHQFLHFMAEIIQRKLQLFKPSELHRCLKAFSAFGYSPPDSVLKAVSDKVKESIDAPHTSGKRTLDSYIAQTTNGSVNGAHTVHAL